MLVEGNHVPPTKVEDTLTRWGDLTGYCPIADLGMLCICLSVWELLLLDSGLIVLVVVYCVYL